MLELIEKILDSKLWAVVGATNNQSKFGYKIYKRLKNEGYEVYPVNPVYDEVDGDHCFNSIEEIPRKVDCVNMVVSSSLGRPILEKIKNAGIETVWFQPGTWDSELISYTKSLGINAIYDHCVLVELSKRK